MGLKDTSQYYHEVLRLIPPRPNPVFEDKEMQIRVWGRKWGVYNDVGFLKMVLVHRPGEELEIMTPDKYDPNIEALIDVREQWYWRRKTPPNLGKMQNEHAQMVEILQREGTEIVNVDCSPRDPKAMFTRDNGVVVGGGVIIARMGPVGQDPGTGRRGEEAFVMRKLVELGMPILRTIHGSGLFEGGSFAFLDENTAVIGLSYRQNEEAARQIEQVLAVQGITLIRVPLTGYSLHLDGAFVMVDHDLALINLSRLPFWFLDLLKERHVKTVEVHHADNPMVINGLAIKPGRLLLATNNGEGTAERLSKEGVEVIPIDYSECQHNGGGIHCSTMPLIRDRD